MNKKLSITIWIIICIALVCLIGYTLYTVVRAKTDKVSHPEVTFEIENYGTVKMELYPEYAPNTVTNFIKLVESGYYNGKAVYGKDGICLYMGRTVEGDAVLPKLSLIDNTIEPDSDEDYEYEIYGEFALNGFEKNTLKHEKGVVSLIRSDYTSQVSSLIDESNNSGSAQIGVMIENNRNLNGVYAAFGRITEGLDILERMNQELEVEVPEDEETSSSIDVFSQKPVITNATVETFGVDYGMPNIHEAFDYTSYLYEMLNSQYQ